MLQKLKNKMSMDLFGMTADDAIAKGVCVKCRKDALDRCSTPAGVREYKLSGLCEMCFDEIFKNIGEEE